MASATPRCGASVYWWDGEYDDICVLPRGHEGDHCDSLGTWYDDDMNDTSRNHEDD